MNFSDYSRASFDRNKARMLDLTLGKKTVLVNAHWPTESGTDQPLFYADQEKEFLHYVLQYNAQVEAMEAGFDNIPFVRVDFGRVPWLLAIAFGCQPVEIGHLINAKPLCGDVREALDRCPSEDILERGFYPEISRRMGLLEERHGPLPFIPSDTQSPIDVATQIVDTQSFLLSLYDDPEGIHALLEILSAQITRICRGQREMVTNWIGYGHDYPLPKGIHLSNDNAAYLSPEIYRDFAAPSIERIGRDFGGLSLHCCMGYSQNLKAMTSIPGFQGFDPQTAYNPVEEIMDANPGNGYWRIHSIPDDGNALSTYKKIIDRALGQWGLLIEVRGNTRNRALSLAEQVKSYAEEQADARGIPTE